MPWVIVWWGTSCTPSEDGLWRAIAHSERSAHVELGGQAKGQPWDSSGPGKQNQGSSDSRRASNRTTARLAARPAPTVIRAGDLPQNVVPLGCTG